MTVARWQQMGKEHFGYDASGNMLFNRDYDLAYGVGNRLLGDTCDRVSFTYDDDGNVTSKTVKVLIGETTSTETTQYRWDSEGRLIGITKPEGTVIAYQYDELGRRMRKAKGSQQWQWTYLGEDIWRETSSLGTTTYVHGPGIDEPLGTSGTGYFVADGLGSITRIVDGNGSVLNQYRYTAFGKMKEAEETVSNAYTYTAREWDINTG